MHIAICFWGLLRSLRYTYHSIHQYILQPISDAGHTYEIFLHTYHFNHSYSNIRNKESNMVLNFSDWKILKPHFIRSDNQDEVDKYINIDQYKRYGDPWRNNYTSFLNHLRALYSLYSVSLLVEEQERSSVHNFNYNNNSDSHQHHHHQLPIALNNISKIDRKNSNSKQYHHRHHPYHHRHTNNSDHDILDTYSNYELESDIIHDDGRSNTSHHNNSSSRSSNGRESGSYTSRRNSKYQHLRIDHINYDYSGGSTDSSSGSSSTSGSSSSSSSSSSDYSTTTAITTSKSASSSPSNKYPTNKYDAILFVRPDVTYLNEIPIYLLELFEHTLFVPDFHRSCQGQELNDRMSMGSYKEALVYGKRFQHALQYSRHKELHSETFTYDILQKNKIKIIEIPFRFKRTRSNGDFHVRDKEAIVAPSSRYEQPTYHTHYLVRWFYSFLEFITFHAVYIWNHDDDDNLYCSPQIKFTLEQCQNYEKKSYKIKKIKGTKVE